MYVSSTPSVHPIDDQLRWSIPTMAVGAEQTFMVQVLVRKDTLRANARVRSDTPDPDLSDNRDSTVTRVAGH